MRPNEAASENTRISKKLKKNGIWVEVDKLVCAELEFEIWLIARAEPTLWLSHYTDFSLLQSFAVSEVLKYLGFDKYQVWEILVFQYCEVSC